MNNPYHSLTPEVKPMENAKSIFQSKTLWFNVITTIVTGLTYLINSDILAEKPEIIAGIGMVIGIANIVLRLVTTKAIIVK